MRVHVAHTTRLDYSSDVVEAVMDTRLGPLSDAHQRWEVYALRAAPAASVRRYSDGFGNVAHLITISRRHRYVEIVSGGEVDTLLDDPFATPAFPPRPLTPSELHDYLTFSPLIPRVPALLDLARPYQPRAPEGSFDAVQGLMAWVYGHFTYRQDVTTVATTVPDILEGGIGVCQDFAHVLTGLCRAVGVPARYVSGYIVTPGTRPTQTQQQQIGPGGMSQSQVQGPQGPPPPRGAGASHAWIEAWTPTHGWRGFDPTNNLLASTMHVKMASGRDYMDVPPSRGMFRGEAGERLTVEVVARPID